MVDEARHVMEIFKPVAIATLVSGTLDIAFAMLLTTLRGRSIGGMLRSVASGPVPPATDWGVTGAVLGLVVHYVLMAIMATIIVLFVRRYADAARPDFDST